MDEKDLVRRCRTGEPGARQEMYETYAGRVLAVCRRYIRESDRARDLVHDTFLKAWDSLDSFRPRRTGSLGAWLSQIAAHLAVDELRRRKQLVLTGDDQPGLAESHSGPVPPGDRPAARHHGEDVTDPIPQGEAQTGRDDRGEIW